MIRSRRTFLTMATALRRSHNWSHTATIQGLPSVGTELERCLLCESRSLCSVIAIVEIEAWYDTCGVYRAPEW
jgi:hypothetical protein